MHPAFSVIFFTVFSGAGYGLLAMIGALVALGWLPTHFWLGLVGLGLGLAAVTFGLLSSTWHLGHPERAWRAISQWRSSWLSREGVAAILSYGPVLLLAIFWLLMDPFQGNDLLPLWGWLTAAMAVVTVICTGMIYASLKTIPAWHNIWTVPGYLAMGLASGAMWLLVLITLMEIPHETVAAIALAAIALSWIIKGLAWRHNAVYKPVTTLETATGLGSFGAVKPFEGPHHEENYLLQEMGYQIARKHAENLRSHAHALAFGLPAICALLSLLMTGPIPMVAAAVGAVFMILGLVVERWLFFAEAKHVVTLYYRGGEPPRA